MNARRNPIVFDPVAVGATKYRFSAAQGASIRPNPHRKSLGSCIETDLLNAWQASVIKGNAAEIGALAKSDEARQWLLHILQSYLTAHTLFSGPIARRRQCG